MYIKPMEVMVVGTYFYFLFSCFFSKKSIHVMLIIVVISRSDVVIVGSAIKIHKAVASQNLSLYLKDISGHSCKSNVNSMFIV